MKLAITTTEPTLEAVLDPRFGRCAYFLIVDPDTMQFDVIENANASLGGGAGIQSAQLVGGQDVQFVVTGNCGPNAHETLTAAGIGVIAGCSGTARQAVEQFKAGGLQAADEPTAARHAGMTGPASASPGQGGSGGGRGMGRGMGQGMGRGQGRGQGGGGMGRGRGRGRGMGA